MNPNPPEINPNKDMPALNPGGINPADLMSEIQKQLLSTSGAISSSNSKIENTITGAISKLKESNTASKGATEIAYDKKIDTATALGQNTETSFLEAQRGYATNTAALRDLRTNNAKAISDLEDSKQMALLSADSATASKISDLILQKYDFEQKATQQVFSNLVSLNNIAIQSAQEKRLNATQTFNEDQAKSNIALKYGIEVKAGDTLQDVVNRAKPFASAEEKMQLDIATAQLEQTRAQTKLALAQATKALQADKKAEFTSSDFDVFIKSAVGVDPKVSADSLKAQIQKLDISADQRKAGYAAVDAYFASKKETEKSSVSQGVFKTVTPELSSNPSDKNFLRDITDWFTLNILKENPASFR